VTDGGANVWSCWCGNRIESETDPACECDRCDHADKWTEEVIAKTYPREGDGGEVICGHCGESFLGYHGPKTAGWYCPECKNCILPRTQPVRFEETRDVDTGEQAGLSRGEWA